MHVMRLFDERARARRFEQISIRAFWLADGFVMAIEKPRRWRRSDITTESVRRACESEKLTIEALRDMYPRCPEKVLYAALWREDDKGNINYGTSIRSAWWMSDEEKASYARRG